MADEPTINDPATGPRERPGAGRTSPGGGGGTRNLLILAGVLVVLVAIAIIVANMGDDPEELDEAVTDPREAFVVDGSIGEPVVYTAAGEGLGAWEVTVTVREVECGIETTAEIEPGFDQFCAVHMDVENTGERPGEGMFDQGSAVSDEEGRRYTTDTLATAELMDAQEAGDLAGTPLAVGERGEWSLVFGVPDDVELALLHLRASPDDDEVVIDLAG